MGDAWDVKKNQFNQLHFISIQEVFNALYVEQIFNNVRTLCFYVSK